VWNIFLLHPRNRNLRVVPDPAGNLSAAAAKKDLAGAYFLSPRAKCVHDRRAKHGCTSVEVRNCRSSAKHVRDAAFVAVAPAVAFAAAVTAVMALELWKLPRTTGKTSRQQHDLFVQTSQ